jgi:hypothetical protein
MIKLQGKEASIQIHGRLNTSAVDAAPSAVQFNVG